MLKCTCFLTTICKPVLYSHVSLCFDIVLVYKYPILIVGTDGLNKES